jgi:hypothetical protein
MSPVLRPIYKEGQILGAGDLNAQLNYERLGAVLHERTEHLWGVAQGLLLETIEQTANDAAKTKYVDVNLSPGRAVDRLGQSIVVSQALPLEPEAFTKQVKPDDTSLFPVFVQAIEVAKAGETAPGKCSVALTSRIEEAVQISFGSPGEEIAVLEQSAATVDEGFGKPALTDKVLVGWVRFNTTLGKFASVTTTANGIRVRYVGVVASDVVAGGGVLTLHTRPDGSRYAVSIAEDSTGGCLLQYGKQDGNGDIVWAFKVDEKGNVSYKGTLTPAPIARTLAESGVAFDGIRLPLPVDVTQEQFDQKTVRVHTTLVPFPQVPALRALPFDPTIPRLAIPIVNECRIDEDTRLVHSTIRWQDAHNETNFIITPNACTYLMVASGKK